MGRLKSAINEKRPELASRRVSFSIRTTSDLSSLYKPDKNYYSLAVISYSTWHTHLPLYQRIYHLFRFLQNYLGGKDFNSLDACKKRNLDQFITHEDANLWDYEIVKLLQRWRKVVEQNDTNVVMYKYLNNFYAIHVKKKLRTFVLTQ